MDNAVYFGASKEIKKCWTCYCQRNFWLASSVRLFISTGWFDVETKAEKKKLSLWLELNVQNCNLYLNVSAFAFLETVHPLSVIQPIDCWQINCCQSIVFTRIDDRWHFIGNQLLQTHTHTHTQSTRSHQSKSVSDIKHLKHFHCPTST